MTEVLTGEITVDGLPIHRMSRIAVRRGFCVIPQDPILLSGTVRSNVDISSARKSDAAIIEALSAVGLWPEAISGRGRGLNTDIDEISLSQGQKQLFCLARAILNKSQVVLIDECSASVDLETEELIMQIIEKEFAGCTILAIAHRLKVLRGFDRIIVMEGGKIVEDTRPEERFKSGADRSLRNHTTAVEGLL